MGRGSQVTETGGKGVTAGQEGAAGCGSEMTGTVRGHLVDRTRMAVALFEQV